MTNLLVISKHSADQEFVRRLASRIGGKYQHLATRHDVRRVLVEHPDALVFWDAENMAEYDSISEILPKYVGASRIFAITEKPMAEYPDLFRYQIFDHHLVRNFTDPALEIYERVARATVLPDPPGLSHYFPEETAIKQMTLSKSAQKFAAIEAMQNHLTQQKVGGGGRLPVIVAQAMDELISNALFDAPVNDSGQRTRWKLDRSESFDLSPREKVLVELASTDAYMGICVTDQFGSLKRDVLVESLGKHYRRLSLTDSASETDRGLGLRGVLEAGLSLLVITVPGVRTQAMLFFRKTGTFREFRSSFRFVSMFAE